VAPRPGGLARACEELTRCAAHMAAIAIEVITRQGVFHSFRAALIAPGERRVRPIYFLVDVVVSVCYYEDEITDPEERGNPIPEVMFQETGYCIEVETYNPE
jgi:hypothetical protein